MKKKRIAEVHPAKRGRPLKYSEWFELVPNCFVITYPASKRKTIKTCVRQYNRKYGLKLASWMAESGEIAVEAK